MNGIKIFDGENSFPVHTVSRKQDDLVHDERQKNGLHDTTVKSKA